MMFKDPVCGMELDEKKAIKLEKDGKVYFLCSKACRDTFLGKKAETSGAQAEASGKEKAIIKITGMHCASCVATVENALRKAPGVSSANVNFGSEKAYVDYDPAKITLTDLHQVIDKIGYKTIMPREAEGKATLNLKVIGMDNPHCLGTVDGALGSL
ncbi:MAG: cation transporter, partial [Desulfobacteraceae bacterium]